MILSDICIHKATKRERNALIIDPPFKPGALQPASLDITLGAHVSGNLSTMRWADQGSMATKITWEKWERDLSTRPLELHQDDFVLGTTEQTFTIPDDLCASLSGVSSLARLGLQVHATAGWIDPGFRGQITLEISNLSRKPILLTAGMRIAQLVFMQMCCPPMHPYGDEEIGSHYQDQTGATRSYLETSL